MTRYAIDAAALIWATERRLSVGAGDSLVAPSRILGDALTMLLRDVQAETRTERDALGLHKAMTETRIRLLGDRVSRANAWQIALDRDWSDLRDAEYLAVAKLQADALAAADQDLAAEAEGIIPTVSPETAFPTQGK